MAEVTGPGGNRILLVEDDAALRLALSDRLSSEGYEVDTVRDGRTGAARASEAVHDLVLLDVMLPEKDGFEVVRDLRGRGVRTPVLMLTARAAPTDKVVGLQAGADDYLTKPFEFVELLARIRAMLRRAAWAAARRRTVTLRAGDLHVDFEKAEARNDGHSVELSAKEWQLLRYFAENPGVVLSRNELLDAVWGQDAMPSTRTVDVHVARLRQKLEAEAEHPKVIVTVRGLGYKLSA